MTFYTLTVLLPINQTAAFSTISAIGVIEGTILRLCCLVWVSAHDHCCLVTSLQPCQNYTAYLSAGYSASQVVLATVDFATSSDTATPCVYPSPIPTNTPTTMQPTSTATDIPGLNTSTSTGATTQDLGPNPTVATPQVIVNTTNVVVNVTIIPANPAPDDDDTSQGEDFSGDGLEDDGSRGTGKSPNKADEETIVWVVIGVAGGSGVCGTLWYTIWRMLMRKRRGKMETKDKTKYPKLGNLENGDVVPMQPVDLLWRPEEEHDFKEENVLSNVAVAQDSEAQLVAAELEGADPSALQGRKHETRFGFESMISRTPSDVYGFGEIASTSKSEDAAASHVFNSLIQTEDSMS